MTWLLIARMTTKVQSAGMICFAEREGERQEHGRSECARQKQERQGGNFLAGALDRNQIAGVEQPGEEGEHVPVQVAEREFRAAAHQQARRRALPG